MLQSMGSQRVGQTDLSCPLTWAWWVLLTTQRCLLNWTRCDPHSPHCTVGASPAPPWSWPRPRPCVARSAGQPPSGRLVPGQLQASGPTPSWQPRRPRWLCGAAPDEEGRVWGLPPVEGRVPEERSGGHPPGRTPASLPPTAADAGSHSQLGHPRLRACPPPVRRSPRGVPGGSACQGLTPFPLVGSPAPGAWHSQTRCSGPAALEVRT